MTNPVQMFFDYATLSIDEKGIYPQPGLVIRDDGTKEICALAQHPLDIYKWFWERVLTDNVSELLFGLDRTTQEGQGTKYADVLTCVHWKRDFDSNPLDAFRVGVINYQHDPRIVDPFDWDNSFWQGRIGYELKQTRPAFILTKASQ